MAALSDLVAAAIRVLPVGGYPREQFVDKSVADIYGCVICTEVARDAVESRVCGHIYCERCLQQALGHQKKCPICREALDADDVQATMFVRRQINSCKVFCDQKAAGCKWQDCLGQRDAHNNVCDHAITRCKLCEGLFPRHLRQKHVENECPMRFEHDDAEVKCPNACGGVEGAHSQPVSTDERKLPLGVMLRRDLSKHLAVCPLQTVCCRYSRYGCEFKCMRKDLPQHVDNPANVAQHLLLADKTNVILMQRLEALGVSAVDSEAAGTPVSSVKQELLKSAKAGAMLDVRDTMDQWLPAKVQARQGNMIFVHYMDWEHRWDEWLDLTLSERIAAYRTHTGGPTTDKFKVSDWVEVYCDLHNLGQFQWNAGVVQQIVGTRVCVSVEAIPTHIAHWILADDPKLIHLGQARPTLTPDQLINTLSSRPAARRSSPTSAAGAAAAPNSPGPAGSSPS